MISNSELSLFAMALSDLSNKIAIWDTKDSKLLSIIDNCRVKSPSKFSSILSNVDFNFAILDKTSSVLFANSLFISEVFEIILSFIEFNDNGDKRTNEAYNKNMKDTAGTSPEEYEPQLEQQVVDKQSAEIDGVSGATSSSDKAKALFVAAIENANEGNTEKELVE